MDKIGLCKYLKPLLRKVIVASESRVLSAGTGVVVKEDGTMLTAKHVIADMDIGYYHGQILASAVTDGKLVPYFAPLSFDFEFDFKLPDIINPLRLDISVLKPMEKQSGVQFIPLSDRIHEEGTYVLMAGFPDDVDLPFHFMDSLNKGNPDIQELVSEYQKRFKFLFRQLIFKHAMVGNTQLVILRNVHLNQLQGYQGPTTINIDAAIYWMDNHLTYGGSGGPLVNEDGELVGIVTEKAFTRLKPEAGKEPSIGKIPSGTGMAISHKLLTWLLPSL